MTLEKACVQKGCSGYPMYGVGLASKGPVRWACRDHKDLIGFGAPHPVPKEDGQGIASPAARPSSPVPRQGRLFG